MDNEVEVRRLNENEWPVVLPLIRQLQFQRVKDNPRQWAMSLHDPERPTGFLAIGAWRGESLVGVAYGQKSEDYSRLLDVYVSDGYRHGGIGTTLFKEFVDEAKRQKCLGLVMGENTNSPISSAYFREFGCEYKSNAWFLRL